MDVADRVVRPPVVINEAETSGLADLLANLVRVVPHINGTRAATRHVESHNASVRAGPNALDDNALVAAEAALLEIAVA